MKKASSIYTGLIAVVLSAALFSLPSTVEAHGKHAKGRVSQSYEDGYSRSLGEHDACDSAEVTAFGRITGTPGTHDLLVNSCDCESYKVKEKIIDAVIETYSGKCKLTYEAIHFEDYDDQELE